MFGADRAAFQKRRVFDGTRLFFCFSWWNDSPASWYATMQISERLRSRIRAVGLTLVRIAGETSSRETAGIMLQLPSSAGSIYQRHAHQVRGGRRRARTATRDHNGRFISKLEELRWHTGHHKDPFSPPQSPQSWEAPQPPHLLLEFQRGVQTHQPPDSGQASGGSGMDLRG
jgi:hypothetical protein